MANDEFAAIEPVALLLRGVVEIRSPVCRHHQKAFGPQNTAQLTHPVELKVLWKMRENRKCVHEVKRLGAVNGGRSEPVPLEVGESQVLTAPADRARAYVCPVKLDVPQVGEMANDTPAAASEVEHRFQALNWASDSTEYFAQDVGTCPAGPQEPGAIVSAGHAESQATRRDRDPSVGRFRATVYEPPRMSEHPHDWPPPYWAASVR